MTEEIKHISIKEFCELGYLQEANRLFFHPRGLALEVTAPEGDEDFDEYISGVWDYRDDPEGMIFGGGGGHWGAEIVNQKAATVQAEYDRHASVREALFFGDAIQGIDDEGFISPADE